MALYPFRSMAGRRPVMFILWSCALLCISSFLFKKDCIETPNPKAKYIRRQTPSIDFPAPQPHSQQVSNMDTTDTLTANPSLCKLDMMNLSTKMTLQNFSDTCGLYTLTHMAHEVSTPKVLDQISYSNVSQIILNLHKIFERTYLSKSSGLHPDSLTQSKFQGKDTRKSIGFLKAFKVGGTHIAALLTTYAYVYDLNTDPNPRWNDTGEEKRYASSCIDIAGAGDHPPNALYETITPYFIPKFFCNEALIFLTVRDPVQRIWSGYNHYIKLLRYRATLQQYLQSHHEMLTKPYEPLSLSVDKAISYTSDVTVLSQENMDMSLILLAMKANMTLCDVMYEPCRESNNDWRISKCNDKKPLDEGFNKTISNYLRSTNERMFYDKVMARFRSETSKPELQARLEKYISIRDEALGACSSEISHKAWENVLYVDPKVKVSMYQKMIRFSIFGAGPHNISASWVCMQHYCREKLSLTLFD